jgi:serine/threonine-protein kinase
METEESPTGTRTRSPAFGAVDGRLPPGVVLAGRYRIVGLLGRGGMGEVYRADDLKLRQAVALKFLPPSVAGDPRRLARFYDEVRIAREVSHPNVCRVHDLGEADGHHFLSMEYVDGEDLASLLRRIGRLPADKGLEIARQLCAGLAAAHEKGVLHRDLKPANVMIDGRGRVRLTDFGIADLAERIRRGTGAGTPAYMPPEQFAGREVSVRSDIYSLGLVLYEVFTGKQAFQGATPVELARGHESVSPPRPSSHVTDLDLAIEQVILRCLEKDPEARPASALSVAAQLPGGDPLAAALAAGITPSPEAVAAAGEVGVLPLGVAWMCLSLLILGLVVAGVLGRETALFRHAPFEKPPDVMQERAQQIVKQAGVVDVAADWAGWFESSHDTAGYCGAPVCYVYRQSPSSLEPRSGTVRRDDPPLRYPGMVRVVLGAEGRLVRFSVVPPEFDDTKDPVPPPNWTLLLAEAGFNPADLLPTESRWTPPVASDSRAAWEVREPGRHGRAARVEVAGFRGRRVDFRVVWDWDVPEDRTPASWFPLFHRLFGWWGMNPLGNLFLLLAGVVLARRNLRLGRSDTAGAFRIAAFFFVARALGRLLTGHHVPSPLAESRILEGPLAAELWEAARVCLFYLALEPYVRRRWPQMLISWSRLLIGHLRDPLVGRDILIGALGGTLMGLLWHLSYFVPTWFGAPSLAAFPGGVETLSSMRRVVGDLLGRLGEAIQMALIALFLLTLYRILTRKDEIAVSLLLVTQIVFNFWWYQTSSLSVEVTFLALIWVTSVTVLVRFGLLAQVAALFFFFALQRIPIALDFNVWYAGHALLALSMLAFAAAYAFYVSLAARPAFGGRLLEE